MPKTVYADRNDPETLPWQPGCHVCSVLKRDLRIEGPMASLVSAIGTHMEGQHDIELRNPR